MIDGHDLCAVDDAFTAAAQTTTGAPTVIVAKTVKGRGFSEVEDRPGWHGKAFAPDMAQRAVAELGGVRNLVVRSPAAPQVNAPALPPHTTQAPIQLPRYIIGQPIATRHAYGQALVAVGAANPKVVALDGEVSNSTYADGFAHAYPDRFFEMFIAEQQLVAAATGLAVRGYLPFVSTFAAFFTRAHDFIRMGAISGVDLRLVGSHAGVEIGADGPSQMALEDLAMMRAIHGSTVLCPCDATSTAALVAQMLTTSGISYLRTTRGAYPVLYAAEQHFAVGGSHVLRANDNDTVTLIGAGVTVHACLSAADRLADQGIAPRVIDCYSIKPVDTATIAEAAAVTGGRLVIAEDHHREGGLGCAVTDALLAAGVTGLRVAHLAVSAMPGSGSGKELMAWAGIDAEHIAAAAQRLASSA